MLAPSLFVLLAFSSAPAGALEVSPDASDQAEQAKSVSVKGSKSNTSERQMVPTGPVPEPAQATNLNSSKSNIYREMESSGPSAEPAAATTVKSSKSNSSERQTVPIMPPAEPAEASNLNLSKSNVDRETGQDEDVIPCAGESQTDCD